jgi:hypothetical protein
VLCQIGLVYLRMLRLSVRLPVFPRCELCHYIDIVCISTGAEITTPRNKERKLVWPLHVEIVVFLFLSCMNEPQEHCCCAIPQRKAKPTSVVFFCFVLFCFASGGGEVGFPPPPLGACSPLSTQRRRPSKTS